MNKIWKRIKGFSNYEISQNGDVRKWDYYNKGKYVPKQTNENGDECVHLKVNKKSKLFTIKELILQHFEIEEKEKPKSKVSKVSKNNGRHITDRIQS